jgi:RIO-like serine/threonine protein kinase
MTLENNVNEKNKALEELRKKFKDYLYEEANKFEREGFYENDKGYDTLHDIARRDSERLNKIDDFNLSSLMVETYKIYAYNKFFEALPQLDPEKVPLAREVIAKYRSYSIVEPRHNSSEKVISLINAGCSDIDEIIECALREIKDYNIIKKLGEGSDGVVFHAEHALLGDVKIKIFKNNPEDKIKQAMEKEGITLEERIRRRIKLFDKKVRDKTNITQLYEVGKCLNPFHAYDEHYLTMDYVDGGAIEQKDKDGNYKIREDIAATSQENIYKILNIYRKILNGLDKIHDAGLVLKDVKLRNILVSYDHKTVLIDDLETIAGIEEIKAGERLTEGSDRYAAPEVIKDIKNATNKSDAYSSGVCLLYMITRNPTLMTGINNAPEYEYERKLDKMLWEQHFSDEQYAFFSRILNYDPAIRFDVKNIQKFLYML